MTKSDLKQHDQFLRVFMEQVKLAGTEFLTKFLLEDLSYMVNGELPRISPEEQPFALRYAKQLKKKGIPEWAPEKP